MRALVLRQARGPLELLERPSPTANAGQVKLRVLACGVCRTDLHVLDGELRDSVYPRILGHQIVGRIEAVGEGVEGLAVGQKVGVPWLGWTCGHCAYCARGAENLCDSARFTGSQIDGGFAEECVVDTRYAFPLADDCDPLHTAPLLCAGLIGARSLRMAGDAARLGFYGFGSAAHLATQVAIHQGREVYAFVRPGDEEAERFARSLGASWTGPSDSAPPEPLDAAVLFAPVGALIPAALRAVRKGGRVVCAGIHMSDIPSFPYEWLWGERSIVSVANLTRADGLEFLELASRLDLKTHVTSYPLEKTAQALEDLRKGRLQGAAVIVP